MVNANKGVKRHNHQRTRTRPRYAFTLRRRLDVEQGETWECVPGARGAGTNNGREEGWNKKRKGKRGVLRTFCAWHHLATVAREQKSLAMARAR